MKYVGLLIFFVFYFVHRTYGDLTLSGPRCGSINCNLQEYCSNFDNRCHPCSEVCQQTTHNYDPSVCFKSCQDYLHDIRYVRRDEGGSSSKDDLRVVVQKLQHMVTVTLTLTCIVLLISFFLIGICLWKWKKNKNITLASIRKKLGLKETTTTDTKQSGNGFPGEQVISGKPDLRIEMPTTGSKSENSPVTVTTSISRRPAEDSALDYAYDNHAMSGSPSPTTKPHESNF